MNRRELIKAGIAGLLTGSMPKALLAAPVYYPGMPTDGAVDRMRRYSEEILRWCKEVLHQEMLKGGGYLSATEAMMLGGGK